MSQGQGGQQRSFGGGRQGGYMGGAPGMTSSVGPYMDNTAAGGGYSGPAYSTQSGDAANPAGGGYSGPAYYPTTGDAPMSAPQPTRYPPQIPPMQGNEGSYTGSPGYATSPQTQNPALSAPFNPGTATGEQRPPFSADPPPMGGGTRMPPIQPPPGGWGAGGYSPAPYDPSTDPLAQGSPATPGSGNGLLNFGGGYTPQPMAMTAPGPGRSDGADRMRPPSADSRAAMRDIMQDPAIKSERQARTIEELRKNPNLANDPAAMAAFRQQNLQAAYDANPALGYNANFQKRTGWGAPR